jgi:ABC-type dipeptide/oligopeptide/nickel transport system ATPase subunit
LPERGQIQVVFQDSHDSLNPRFTAFDCIAEPLRRLAHLPSRQATRVRVEELAKMVHLPAELLGRFPHQLSGGQQARVNIARAIALQPRLLILDEPTSALDVSVQARILQLLDGLRRHLGMTYLFVSHNLNVVRLLCDRVMVMYLGKVVEIGAPKAVFNDPYLPIRTRFFPRFRAIANGHDPSASISPVSPAVRLTRSRTCADSTAAVRRARSTAGR